MQQPLNPNLTTSSQKSTPLLCLVKCLAFSGLVPVPLVSKEGKLVPSLPWKNFSLPNDPLEAVKEIQKLFSKENIAGIALKTGEPSGLVVLDIDDPEKFNSFYPLEKLINEAPYVVKTKDEGHWHIGFSWDPDFVKSKSFLKDYGFEIKSNGSLVNFFSIIPEAQYKPIRLEPLKSMPKELKEKILNLMKNQKETSKTSNQPKPKGLDPSQIIELVSEVYQKGQRQYWTIFVAGFLRKLGFTLEETKTALEEFLRNQKDEELQMRLAGIEHTYKEPLENTKGLSGLLELGLSEKTYLKLQNLKIQKKETQTPNKYFTLKDILSLKIKEPSWIIPNILPEGFSILVGKPKTGKSWLALQIALTCAQIQKKVVYFALEDNPGRLQKRLKFLGIENSEGLPNLIFFYFDLAPIDKGAVKEIKKCIEKHKPELIIIDPWVKIKPRARGKDLFTEDYRTLEVLKELTKNEINILLIHHARKTQSEDPIDEVLGTVGQTAAVDNILLLKRIRGNETAVLHLILRDFESTELGLKFENGWKLEGSAKEVMLAEEQRKIVEAIKSLEYMGENATIKKITNLVGKTQGAVKKTLLTLLKKGILSKKQRGVYSFLNTIKKGNLGSFGNLGNLGNFGTLGNFGNFGTLGNFGNLGTLGTLGSQTTQKVTKVTSDTSEVKIEVTIPTQILQTLPEKVTLVTKVTNVSPFSPSIQTPTPELPDQTSNEIDQQINEIDQENKTENEPPEEVVYILMPEDKKCPTCNWIIWEVNKTIYKIGKGVAKCLKCGHVSWFKFFETDGKPKGQIVNKEDLPFLLYNIEIKKNPKLLEETLFEKIKNEGNGFLMSDKLKKWLDTKNTI
ncbi:MAG: AAA family ATPase [Caldimicrobium sp.]|nr:AAA family ATPase [Caldimicrobium sp.]